MTLTHGFKKIAEKDIPELRTRALVYEHAATGGRLLSLISDDENKCFGVTFRTPPADSTGVAHILEHSVLCGSEKYAVKEPFVELLKGSLQTFLNAFTFPDKTSYPVASANTQDFYNLVDVYLDAVFHPRLTEWTLKQEGWHHEVEEDGRLSYKGVVYNEMKGAYSSPDGQLYEYSQQCVFPDTTYGKDSGGDPERIPDLTFEAFMDFHARLYRPSNAFAFFSGDDDPERRLAILDQAFSRFGRTAPAPAVEIQKPFTAPVQLTRPYEAGEDDGSNRAMFTVTFCLPEAADPDMNLAFGILEHILIGLPSSPLRKALTDSGLGEDMAGAGLETDLRQMYFSVGLKGMDQADVDRAEGLVFETLQALVRDGIDPLDVEAALNSVEFDLRENNTGSFPRGLSLMFQALVSWLHDGDPLALLPFEEPLARLKKRLAGGERVFEDLIQDHLVNNTHRGRVLLVPDPELAARREAAERARLEREAAAMGPDDLKRLAEEAEILKNRQEAPDDPAALAAIPRLTIRDLPQKNALIPSEDLTLEQAPVLYHDIFTSGIVYLDLGLDLSAVPDRLMPYVPILGRALLETGTPQNDFVALSQRIACKTGGISPQSFVTTVRGSRRAENRLFLRGKATVERAGDLCAILTEVLAGAKLDNAERIRQIVAETKARREHRLVPAGHSIVSTRLKARMGEAHLVDERMHGVTALHFIRDLAQKAEKDFDAVAADLSELRSLILNRFAVVTNVTVDAKGFEAVRPELAGLLASLPERGALQAAPRQGIDLPGREGLAVPAQVNYVGKAVNLFDHGLVFDGALHAVSKYLRSAYLWEQVRVVGGAYGAFCALDRSSGAFSMVSYRDPNVDRTVEAFDKVADYLRGLRLPHDELEKSVIGAIGEIDSHMLPDAKGFAALARRLNGEDEAYRQSVREQVLSATAKDFTGFAEAASILARKGDVVVLGAKAALEGSSLGLRVQTLL